MKPAPLFLVCLASLAAGVFLGRFTAEPSPPAASDGNPPTSSSGTTPKALPAPELISQLKQIRGSRKKSALMLGHLAKARPGTMGQLVQAAGNDIATLIMLSEMALHTDPGGFLNALIEDDDQVDGRTALLHNFVKTWAKVDFDSAFAASRNCPHDISNWLGGAMLETLLDSDPATALKMAVAHPALHLPWNNEVKIPATPENVALVRALPSSMGKFAMIRALSAGLSTDEALSMVFDDRSANPLYGAHRVAEAIVQKDPAAAEAWVIANPGHPAAHQLARRVGEHLVETNPAAAVTWAAAHLSGSQRTRIIEKAASALHEKDPAGFEAARDLLPDAFKLYPKP